MPSLEKIKEYVDTICGQIRWKSARNRIFEEMTNHIVDGRDSFMAQGLDENGATEKAISETGDAETIGTQLDRIHRPKPQWSMFAATAVLLILGLLVRLFVFNDEDRFGLLSVRLACTGLGIVGMIAAYFIDFTIIGKYPKIIYFGIISISLAVLFCSPIVNGRSFYGQYIVLLFPLAFVAIIFATRNKGYLGIILCGLAFALLGFIALYMPSISGFLHFVVTGAVLLGIAIYKKWFGSKRINSFLLMSAPFALLAIIFLMSMTPYRWDRLAVAINPALDPNGAGYMSVMVRELLKGATLFGQGIIPSEYVVRITEPHSFFYTDLLLTALISLLGWVTFAVIVGALLFFMAKGFKRCFKQKSNLGLFVSAAIMMTFSLQVVSYVAFNLGFLFTSPISLPLISHGNTATIINLVLIGFMSSVFRTGDIMADGKMSSFIKKNRFITWTDGKLTFNFKVQG